MSEQSPLTETGRAPGKGREGKLQALGTQAVGTLYLIVRNVRMYDALVDEPRLVLLHGGVLPCACQRTERVDPVGPVAVLVVLEVDLFVGVSRHEPIPTRPPGPTTLTRRSGPWVRSLPTRDPGGQVTTTEPRTDRGTELDPDELRRRYELERDKRLRADGNEQSQSVVLRRDQPANLSFTFDGAAGGGDLVGGAEAGEAPSIVPGIAALGVGVVGLAIGGFGSLQVVDAENKNEDLVEYTDGNAFRSAQAREDALAAGLDPNEIDQQGRTYQTVQWIGYGVGIAGIGLGTYLLVRAMGGSSETAEASAALPFDFGVAPSKDGVAASLRLRF